MAPRELVYGRSDAPISLSVAMREDLRCANLVSNHATASGAARHREPKLSSSRSTILRNSSPSFLAFVFPITPGLNGATKVQSSERAQRLFKPWEVRRMR